MDRLIPVTKKENIPEEFQGTPVGRLVEYHNLDKPHNDYDDAHLLIGMCMDNRKRLNIPPNFAYVIRTGGGNLRFSEFKISYAIAVGQIDSIVLIGHNHCGMVNIAAKRRKFINGLVENAGWTPQDAEDHFHEFAPVYEIGNELDFVLSEAKRLRLRYPKIQVIPLFYKLECNQLHFIEEQHNRISEHGRIDKVVSEKPKVKLSQ